MTKKLILSLSSALLLAIPWLTGLSFTLLFAFVPLLLLQEMRPRRIGGWAALTFAVWITATTWWVGNATMLAVVAIPVVGLFFSWIPFMVYHYVWKRGPRGLAYTVFIAAWISFEALYMYNEISFPWLTLGYGFGGSHWLVQWYSVTGSFGGSLWILVANVLCLYAWKNLRIAKWRALVPAVCWILVPIAVSYVMYYTWEPEDEPVNVTVLQPNIDPYHEKFDSMTQEQQFDILMTLMRQAPQNTDYIVAPETALDDRIWLHDMQNHEMIRKFQDTLQAYYSKASLVLGATTFRLLRPGEPTSFATRYSQGHSYEICNSALYIDNVARDPQGVCDIGVYHKSKLVVGAETVPYPKVLGLLEKFSIDLGGISGNFGRHDQRYVFGNPASIASGTAICYESVYGEYFNEYVRNGAQIMFIITNDGWWGDTPGYRNHLDFARLRAIETRRSIGRSANTGISALIDPQGNAVESLGWDQRGQISGTLSLNSKLTPYVRWGDMTARVAIFVFFLSILYFIAWKYRRRQSLA